MPELVIPDVEEMVLQCLQQRASVHGRTPEAEAKVILQEVLEPKKRDAWTPVNALRKRLAVSGRRFSDSTDLVREDRER
jgi:plasmid stability protein